MTRPSGESASSVGSISASHARPVASKTALRRLESVSSGPNSRKFVGFFAITSRRNTPRTRVASAVSVPGRETSTA